MENSKINLGSIVCNLCAGSPMIERYPIFTREHRRPSFYTDVCIGEELQSLYDAGVVTYGCCCGHGVRKPSCLVSVDSKKILEELGYELHEYTPRHTEVGMQEIYLKTVLGKKLTAVLRTYSRQSARL